MAQLNLSRLKYKEGRWTWAPQIPTWLPTRRSHQK